MRFSCIGFLEIEIKKTRARSSIAHCIEHGSSISTSKPTNAWSLQSIVVVGSWHDVHSQHRYATREGSNLQHPGPCCGGRGQQIHLSQRFAIRLSQIVGSQGFASAKCINFCNFSPENLVSQEYLSLGSFRKYFSARFDKVSHIQFRNASKSFAIFCNSKFRKIPHGFARFRNSSFGKF